MNGAKDVRRDLEPGMDPAEAAALVELGERLHAARPVPSAAFRGDLRRRLLGRAGRPGSVPGRLRLWIAANGAAGGILLAVAAASVAGLGPLAA
jgi:hypothetical protein